MFTMLLLSCDLLHLLFLFYNPLYIYKKGICPKTCTFQAAKSLMIDTANS